MLLYKVGLRAKCTADYVIAGGCSDTTFNTGFL